MSHYRRFPRPCYPARRVLPGPSVLFVVLGACLVLVMFLGAVAVVVMLVNRKDRK